MFIHEFWQLQQWSELLLLAGNVYIDTKSLAYVIPILALLYLFYSYINYL